MEGEGISLQPILALKEKLDGTGRYGKSDLSNVRQLKMGSDLQGFKLTLEIPGMGEDGHS